VNHDQTEVKPETMGKIQEQGIGYRAEKIQEVLVQGDGRFQGVRLQNGETLQGDRGFIAFGGNAVKSDLVSHLGVERFENKHILTDPRSKMTNVPGVFAAGDIGVHSEQVTIAMGEGQQAAIWMHKSIMQMKEKLKEKEKDKAAALGRI
jgi:thioredoxin reductase